MWVKVEAPGEMALYVGAFYRSSVSDTEKLSPLKDSVTSLCHSTQSHVWLTGDFNLPDMEWNPRSVRNGARYSDSYQVFMHMLDEAHTNCHWTHPRLQHTWLIHHKQWHPDHTLWGHPRHFRSQCRACREPPTTIQAKNTQTKHPNMAKGKLGWHSLPHITGMGTTHRKWHFWQASRPSMAVVQRHTGWGY